MNFREVFWIPIWYFVGWENVKKVHLPKKQDKIKIESFYKRILSILKILK